MSTQQNNPIEPSCYPQVDKVLACRLVDKEYVLIYEQDGADASMVLNHAGSRAFSLMDGKRSIQSIAKQLADDAGLKEENFLPGVIQLVEKLQEVGAVAVSNNE